MNDTVITGEPVETPEAPEASGPPSDSLESIIETMKSTQDRMVDDGTLQSNERIGGDPDEARHDEQSQEQGNEQEQGSDILPEREIGLLDKWNPVLQQVTGQDEVTRETHQQLVDNLMASWTGLQTKPIDTALSIIDQYVPEDQRRQLVTALTHKVGIDPLDIDVEEYAQSQPNPEITQMQQQLQALQAQNVNLQVNQMKASGDYPLLSDASFSQQMAQAIGQYPDLDLPSAYRFIAAKNPNLSAQAAADVPETPQPSTRRLARRGDILPRGKPNGAIYNDIPKNPVEHLRMKRSELI